MRTRRRRRRALVLCATIAAIMTTAACRVGESRAGDAAPVSAAEQQAIEDTLKRLIERAYDFSRGGGVAQLMSLYPDSGRVLSSAAGRVTTSRDSLQVVLTSFWERVGQNMRGPRWTWGETYVDVLSRDAAVFTGTYTVPHRTPAGAPHVVGGAWTALFVRRGGRWVIVQEHLSDIPGEIAPTDSAAAPPHQHD